MSKSFTKIVSNGSHWAGQAPDSIEKLLERLEQYPLDKTFEEYGNFVGPARGAVRCGREDGETVYRDTGPIYPKHPKAVRFFGNFLTISAVFTIDTDDKKLIAKLKKAIRVNQARADYRKAA